ncbi:hypothetical protein IMSAG185_00255 [Lachnospiraceae bacterium]|jgi:uncharacterized membrane protein YgcG|nr:TPM domain-containing protein [Lachnospiraceae bacterium]GFI64666.1 hypothetical protein IMSAG185_00255 [Lachnospiraceae bacterium]
MNKELKKEAKKQYLHYFRIWFVVVGILFCLTAAVGIRHALKSGMTRTNTAAPAERVFDFAEILTEEEEEKLRQYIAQKEAEYGADFVIVTFSRAVEGAEAQEQYGYRSDDWEQNMTDIADDFWDRSAFGFNKGFEGDGSILIDNRYPGQRGEWLSTSGKVEEALSAYDVESVLYAVDDYYDSDPCKAYLSYIDKVCSYLDGGALIHVSGTYYVGAVLASVLVALIYGASHLGKNRAGQTVAVNAYVVGGKPVMQNSGDDLIRKNVVKRHIQRESSSGGGSRGSGGGGHHVSRSGASHGGGGHRH